MGQHWTYQENRAQYPLPQYLLLLKGGRRLGFEFKYTDHPKVTKSMYIAQQDLKLDHLALLYPGHRIFPLEKGITAYGLETLATGEFAQKFEMRG